MESTSISQSCIEDLCIELMSSIAKQWKIYKKCKRNPDWIANNFIGGISESVFYCFIKKSKNNFLLRNLLPFFVDCVIDESITDKIFSLLFSYRFYSIKEQMLISLSHKHLPVHMLRKLCETNICFECYFELATTVYQNDATSEGDVQDAMDCFLKSPFSKMIKELIIEMNACNTTSFSKKNLLKTYAQLYTDLE